MKKSIVIALAVILVSAMSASAQVSIEASYLASLYPLTYPTAHIGISSDFAVGVDYDSPSFHTGAKLIFWSQYLALEAPFDLILLRSSTAGPVGYSFGIGPELWLSYFPTMVLYPNLYLYLQAHLPFDMFLKLGSDGPIQLFVRLSPYVGFAVVPTVGNVYYGMDVYLGARYVFGGGGTGDLKAR